jgi:hypothetical protein
MQAIISSLDAYRYLRGIMTACSHFNARSRAGTRLAKTGRDVSRAGSVERAHLVRNGGYDAGELE